MKAKSPGAGFRVLFTLLSAVIAAALILVGVSAAVLVYCNSAPRTGIRPVPGSGVTLENGAGETGDRELSERGPPDSQGAELLSGTVLFEVNEGESAYSVGRRLEQAGLIRTRYFWNILSRVNNEFLKAGTYRLQFPASQTEIRSALVAGRQILIRVTIPEGVTLKKIAGSVEEAGICPAESFLAAAADQAILDEYRIPGKTMEGYLYPETYYFPQDFPAKEAVHTMADTFFNRIAEIEPASAAMTPEELNAIVILASIVERECQVNDEAALMADVFLTRLEIGMALQSNATVEYVITEIQGKPHPVRQFNRDTEIDDPYNTYVYFGLPPGPIAAPGKNALDAVFHPAETEYLYFRVIDPDSGRHYFSRTFAEHLKAGENYVPRDNPAP
jgi:UPF0755 protein